MPRDSSKTYGAVSLTFHWLTALFIIAMFALGWGSDFMPGDWRRPAMGFHKSLGLVILFLVFLRLSWRARASSPALPKSFSKIQKCAAHGAHALLYVFMVAMPISGWLMISAAGKAFFLFDLVAIPPLMAKNPSFVPFLKDFHAFAAYGFAGMIVLHAAAGLQHHFIYKDNILRRMIPCLKEK